MEQGKHTEGWKAKYRFASRLDHSIQIVDDGGFVVATIDRQGRKYPSAHKQETQEANASLMEAAPKLLEALEALVKDVTEGPTHQP